MHVYMQKQSENSNPDIKKKRNIIERKMKGADDDLDEKCVDVINFSTVTIQTNMNQQIKQSTK